MNDADLVRQFEHLERELDDLVNRPDQHKNRDVIAVMAAQARQILATLRARGTSYQLFAGYAFPQALEIVRCYDRQLADEGGFDSRDTF